MTKKGGKGKKLLAWCWYCHPINRGRYCDREFEDEKVLILHQKAKHFKCLCCSRRLNSASGLIVHIAQIHKESIDTVPNSVPGHDTPEIDIFGMQGIPPEDLQRHFDGLPPVPYKRSKLGDAGLVSLLAAQKAATSGNPLPMSIHVPLKSVQVIEGIGPSQAIPHLPKSMEGAAPMYPPQTQSQVFQSSYISSPFALQTLARPEQSSSASKDTPTVQLSSFSPIKISSVIDPTSGKKQTNCYLMMKDADVSPVLTNELTCVL
jgi:hypothetical protein